MKMRLLNLVAIAAIAMGAQAAAQQDSLERAIADLNAGVVAPMQGNVSAPGSTGLSISGDARLTNWWTDPDGGVEDQIDLDARVRVNMAWDVNGAATAFVQMVGAETFGTNFGAAPRLTAGTRGGSTGHIHQAYFTANNLLGLGGDWKVGRSAFVVGSGRILGTDEWDQVGSTYTGTWFGHECGGANTNMFMVRLADSSVVGGDVDLYGMTFDYGLDLPGLGSISMTPYILHGMNENAASTNMTTLGANFTGDLWVFDYNAEAAWQDSYAAGASYSDAHAWAVDLGVNIEKWVSGLPGGLGSTLTVGSSRSDNFGTVDPIDHAYNGIADQYQIWAGTGETHFGIGFEPVDGWKGGITYYEFEDDASEWDFTLDHALGAGVGLHLGIASLSDSAADGNSFYMQLSLPF